MSKLYFFAILSLFVCITKAHWGLGTVHVNYGANIVPHVSGYRTHGYYNHGVHGMPDHTHFEFYYPKGVKVWKLIHGGICMFGIKFSINPDLTKQEIPCDICVNTTTNNNGRLLIEDDNLMVRPGDKVAYVSHFQMGNHIHSFPLKTIIVTEQMMKTQSCPEPTTTTVRTTTAPTTTTTTTKPPTTTTIKSTDNDYDDKEEFQCVLDPKTNLCVNDPLTIPGKVKDASVYKDEIRNLEEIIMYMIGKCGAPTQLLVDPKGKIPITTPLEFMKSIAEKEKLPQELIDSIILVEMDGNIMKVETKDPMSILKILNAAKDWKSAIVQDPINGIDVRTLE